MNAERLEDMSTIGRLRLRRDGDGDVVVTVQANDGNAATVEFCQPRSGGVGSPRTFDALRNLFEAMRADNMDRACQKRRPPGTEGPIADDDLDPVTFVMRANELNVYDCSRCKRKGIAHSVDELPAGYTSNASHWGSGLPKTIRKCSSCGHQDGPWSNADIVGGCY